MVQLLTHPLCMHTCTHAYVRRDEYNVCVRRLLCQTSAHFLTYSGIHSRVYSVLESHTPILTSKLMLAAPQA